MLVLPGCRGEFRHDHDPVSVGHKVDLVLRSPRRGQKLIGGVLVSCDDRVNAPGKRKLMKGFSTGVAATMGTSGRNFDILRAV